MSTTSTNPSAFAGDSVATDPHAPEAPSRRERVRDEIGHRAERAQHATQAAGQQVAEAAQSATEQGTKFVRDNPGLALAGALGVGVLIGMAMRERY